MMIKVMTCRLNGGKGKGGRPYSALPANCSFLVSVGKEHFSGAHLSSTLALINAEFESCTIIVTGTLQKYNIATEKKITYDQAYTEAVEKENAFILIVKSLIERLEKKCNFTFVKWDEYTNNDKFKSYLDQVDALLEKNQDFNSAMELTVEEFCEKHEGSLSLESAQDMDLFKENSRLFLREKCAAMFMWRGMIIYSSGVSPVLGKMSLYINQVLDLAEEQQISWQALRFKETRVKNLDFINSEKSQDFLDTAILQKPKSLITKISGLPGLFADTNIKEMKHLDIATIQIILQAHQMVNIRTSLMLLEHSQCGTGIMINFLSDLITQLESIRQEISANSSQNSEGFNSRYNSNTQ